jgi:hypothetical protein
MEGKHMKIQTTAADRKDIVRAMEEILNVKAKYQGPPTFGYQVGDYTVDRDGCVEHDSEEQALAMQEELTARGLIRNEPEGITVGIPLEGFSADSLKNLIFMIHSKQYLLAKSIGVEVFWVSDRLVERLEGAKEADADHVIQIIGEETPKGISLKEDRICFGEFPEEAGNTDIYAILISKMAKAAKEAKRIHPKETIEENEKYYMRTWLVRIGLDGKDTKSVRKALLEKLKGHSAFRTEADRVKWQERNGRKSAPEGGAE